ncbi:MAG: nuclear transport factor 2 family protein [Candidatus Korobacteraceae bacterium]
MRRSPSLLAILVIAFGSIAIAAATPPAQSSKTAPVKPAPSVDKAYLQSIWNGWASNDVEKQGQFYAQGPDHLFFDVAPLKYTNWEEYKAGVAPSLKDSPKVTFTLNDDVQIHPEGNVTWVDGTLKMEGASPQADKQTLNLRWTAVFKQQDGRWLIEHEHISVPAEIPQQ